jgi:endo-1,4-beta-xylanase
MPPAAPHDPPAHVRRAQGAGLVAALTFDDGPDPRATPRLLDVLRGHGIRAVFAVVGESILAPGGADILRRTVAEGHVLCNHSTSFADMGGWPAERVRADLEDNLRIIREAAGSVAVPFWRAPNGSWGVTAEVAAQLGMRPLAVTNTILDWETQDVPVLTERLRAALTPGELVLAHDGGGDRRGTVAAVEAVLADSLAAGWRFTLPDGC